MVIRRIVLGVLSFLVLTGLIVGIFVCIQVENLKPVYKGTLSVEGLENSVYIRRDVEGVIHIQGQNVEDVIFASGFVTARERLWQMELMRRVATGRLSEIFGETTVSIDRLFLTLGLDSLTKSLFESISPESRTWLEQYALGINAWLREMGDDVPVEFLLMKIKPQEWTPQDCLLQTRLMAWFLNFSWKADFLYWELSKSLPPEKFREIWPRWRKYPDIIAGGAEGRTNYEIFGLLRQLYALIGVGGISAGSNSWVVSPTRAVSSAAMLANDPHLQIQFPSIWIELHLTTEDLNVAGFALPGSPGIVIGRNDKIAWGLTSGMIDDSDYFIEKIDTTEGIYWINEKKMPLNIRQRVIPVKDKPNLIFNVYSTVNGPILNSLFNDFGTFEPISFKWTGWENSDELKSIIELARSRNWSDFKYALRSYGVPAQNFVFAGITGEIGYRLGGLVPLRNYDNGLLPVNGFSGNSRWQGFIPSNKMPSLLNPKEGFIVTANNQISKDYPHYLSDLWEPPCRAMRIEELIRDQDQLSEADLQRIQFDYKDLMAQEIMPIILPDLLRLPNMTDREEKVLLLLRNWNFVMDTESIAAAVYEELKYNMIRNIFADEMGEHLFGLFTDLPNFYLRIFAGVFLNEQSPWFDNINTVEVENRTTVIQKSFREALNSLIHSQGEEMDTWRWGMVHQLTFKHSLGRVPLTEILFNRGPFSVGGNGCTINVGTYGYKDPFSMIAGASMRMVVNWAQPDQYLSILPGGESGNFLSEYYDNQIERWLSGELKTVSMGEPEAGKKVIILKPKGGKEN
jgi:penicillin amidase